MAAAHRDPDQDLLDRLDRRERAKTLFFRGVLVGVALLAGVGVLSILRAGFSLPFEACVDLGILAAVLIAAVLIGRTFPSDR